MAKINNIPLMIGGTLSVLASLLHIGINIGGADWYRFFGAGETLARLVEDDSILPTIVTTGIATVLFIWGLYAYSGAGLIRPLPFLNTVLVSVSAIYLIRGLALLPAMIFMETLVDPFLIWSSIVSAIFGLSYALGIIKLMYGIEPCG